MTTNGRPTLHPAASPRPRPILSACELEPPAAPVETTKPRPRPRPAPLPLNLDAPELLPAVEAALSAAINATLPDLRAALVRELAARLPAPDDAAASPPDGSAQ